MINIYRTLVFGLWVLPSAVQAANWQLAATSSRGAIWYADVESTKDINDSPWGAARKIWVKIDYSQDKTTKTRESKVLFYIKCNEEQSKYVSWIDYNSEGIVISSDIPTYSGYKPVTPDTMMAGVMQLACHT